MARETLGVDDEGLRGAPLALLGRVTAALLEAGEPGLHLTAPRTLRTASQTSLSVVVGHLGDRLVSRWISLSDRALVVVTDLDRGGVHVESAWSGSAPRALPEPPPRMGDRASEGRAADAVAMELEGAPPAGWRPGSYLLRALAADRLSPPSTLTVTVSESMYDEAVLAFVARIEVIDGVADATRASSPAEGRSEGVDEVDLLDVAKQAFPELPPGEGSAAALAVERVAIFQGATPCALRGAFRVALRNPRALRGAAMLVTLIVTSGSDASPVVRRFAVPVDHPAEATSAPAVVTGRFVVDLARVIAMRPLETYFVTAFVGEAAAGPCTLALVPESYALR